MMPPPCPSFGPLLAHLAGQGATHIGEMFGYTPAHVRALIRGIPAHVRRRLEDLHRRGRNPAQRVAEIVREEWPN